MSDHEFASLIVREVTQADDPQSRMAELEREMAGVREWMDYLARTAKRNNRDADNE